MSDDVEGVIGEAGFGRRQFLRRLAVGSAFAVPVVASFSMAGIQAVSAQADQTNPNLIGNCNQTTIYAGNQGYGGYPSYGRTPTGNVPLCSNANQHGVLGFLQDIFSIHQHPFN